jgi:hypothetical protein
MQSSEKPMYPPSGNHDLPRGLPTVVPPSGKYIAQLFLVPGLIVSGAVLLLLGFNWLAGAPRSTDDYLRGLRHPNPDVRWRIASDLAQMLPRDERLNSNPHFALDLAELLQKTLDETATLEKKAQAAGSTAVALGETDTSAQKELDAGRKMIVYLISVLSHFQAPVGVPLLAQLATETGDVDKELLSQRRERAVWGLAILGDRVQRFPRQVAQRRQEILDALRAEAAGTGRRAEWSAEAIRCLETKSSPVVDEALERCVKTGDAEVRKLVALALNFWEGPRSEELLSQLAEEKGEGGTPGSEGVRRLEVRYQATAALLQRGQGVTPPRLTTLREMLDEAGLELSFRKVVDDKEEPDMQAVHSTMILALKSLAFLHDKRPELDYSDFREPLEKLAHGSSVREEAKEVQGILSQRK